jgi:hypothetical protein
MGMIFLRNRVSGAAPADAYAIGGASPELVAAFLTAADGTTEGEYFRTGGVDDDFSMFTFARSGTATYFDSNGTLVWAPHNLFTKSNTTFPNVDADLTATEGYEVDFFGAAVRYAYNTGSGASSNGQQSTPVTPGATYTLSFWAKDVSGTTGSGYGIYDESNSAYLAAHGFSSAWPSAINTSTYTKQTITFTAPANCTSARLWVLQVTDVSTVDVAIGGVHWYRSDLGGMADNPDQPAGLEKYVPTTSAAVYLSRRNAYYYNSGWTKGGLQLESAAATQLLHGTDSFATQTETVTAQAYTLQFRGTGSIALTGAHTATLTGTGANDLVSLTFTPSAGTLTLTPSGTVDYPQLEVGSIPTSYIPNTAGSGTVARAAEALSIAGADTPFNTTAFTIFMKGLVTYADNNSAAETVFLRVYQDASNNMDHRISTLSGNTGLIQVRVESVNVVDTALSSTQLSPGVNVPFAIATRYTSSAAQVALNGTAGTENGTIASITDMSATAFEPFNTMNGFVSEIRYLGADTAEADMETVTTL